MKVSMLRPIQLLSLVGYAVGMSCGQILFKAAAGRIGETASIFALFRSPYFLAAVAIYGTLSVLWVYILAGLELSVAYPFAALSFVFTPIIAYFVYSETISTNFLAGLVLIVSGLLVIVR